MKCINSFKVLAKIQVQMCVCMHACVCTWVHVCLIGAGHLIVARGFGGGSRTELVG